jgi:glucose dehydrogenase
LDPRLSVALQQYVVIASGGHQFMHTTIGDYVVAYTLQD